MLRLYFFILFISFALALERPIVVRKDISFNLWPNDFKEISMGITADGFVTVHCEFDRHSKNHTVSMADRRNTRFQWYSCDSFPHDLGVVTTTGTSLDNVFFFFPEDGLKTILIGNCGSTTSSGSCFISVRNSSGFLSTTYLSWISLHSVHLIILTFLAVIYYTPRLFSSRPNCPVYNYFGSLLFYKYCLDVLAQIYLVSANLSGNGFGVYVFLSSVSFGVLMGGLIGLGKGGFWIGAEKSTGKTFFKDSASAVYSQSIAAGVLSFVFYLLHVLFNWMIWTMLLIIVFVWVSASLLSFEDTECSKRDHLEAIGVLPTLTQSPLHFAKFVSALGFVYCVMSFIYPFVRLFMWPEHEPTVTFWYNYLYQTVAIVGFGLVLVGGWYPNVPLVSTPEAPMKTVKETPIEETPC
ncbi:hypothetical protein RCL1_007056 [Eukaryota sp. TZLM3-RCL]